MRIAGNGRTPRSRSRRTRSGCTGCSLSSTTRSLTGWFKCWVEWKDNRSQALQGRNKSAQGNALGDRANKGNVALKGRHKVMDNDSVSPLQGLAIAGGWSFPGRCPGLTCCAPSGRKRSATHRKQRGAERFTPCNLAKSSTAHRRGCRLCAYEHSYPYSDVVGWTCHAATRMHRPALPPWLRPPPANRRRAEESHRYYLTSEGWKLARQYSR